MRKTAAPDWVQVCNLEQPFFKVGVTIPQLPRYRIVSHSPPTGALNELDLVAAISAFKDVTVRGPFQVHQAALDLERKRREIFVATLAHELRQPLAAILAAVEVVRLAADSPATARATEVMKRQIGQMNRVVEDLLDAARWARGKVTLRKQRLDLRDVVREAAVDVAAAVAARGHELRLMTASEPLWVNADSQRLHQVLSNLLRNAVKYSDPGGCISLAADRGATTVQLRVSDKGHGIEPEALTHIFDLFAQLRPSEDGLGIGLSVVREIVELHEGRIEARSEGAGHGSEFIVTLPLAPAALPWHRDHTRAER
jgi:signal transduction histidine kinase